MYKIGIIGLGFMGGCIARTLISSSEVESILAFDNNVDSLKQAKKDNSITEYTTNLEDFKNADIIFLCTPVGFIPEYANKLKNIIKSDCVITDIGSTKTSIINALESININFVGGHPMVGSERTGYNTSNDYLFENTYYIITKNKNIDATKKVETIVKELKAIPIVIEPEKHDYIVAAISHVPHIIAAGLVNLVKNLDDENENMKTLAAGGFKDITRIASSDPTMWMHICNENKKEIIPILENYIESLNEVKQKINNSQEIYNFFDSSKKYRDSFINKKINGQSLPTLNVIIKDESGSIAKIANILAEENISIKNIGIVNNRETIDGALNIVFSSFEEQEKGFKIITQNGYKVLKVN